MDGHGMLQNFLWMMIQLFGYVISHFVVEVGYFSINELKSIRGSLCNNVERDLDFKPYYIKDQQAQIKSKEEIENKNFYL